MEYPFNDGPKYYSLRLFANFLPGVTDGNTQVETGFSRGVSHDFTEAISKVIGEFLERYPLLLYKRKKLIRASMNMLREKKKNFLNVFDLAGAAEWQKKFSSRKYFDEDSLFFWAEGKELTQNKRALVPAQLIFWNYNSSDEPQEPFLRQPITNGAAGHFTYEEAVLGGIYENIQRDGFLIYWLNSIPPPRIDPDTILDTELQRHIEHLRRYNFEVVFLDTTLDLKIPSSACAILDKSGNGPRVALGGGCGSSLERSLIRSLTEAVGVYNWARSNKNTYTLPDDYLPFKDPYVDQGRRLLLYNNDDKAFPIMESFLSGPLKSFSPQVNLPNFNSPKEELDYILNTFKSKGRGYEVYVYEAHHEFLETLGYHSARVIMPSLIPLYLRETDAPLGGVRIREVPKTFGLEPSAEPNPWPHPFP